MTDRDDETGCQLHCATASDVSLAAALTAVFGAQPALGLLISARTAAWARYAQADWQAHDAQTTEALRAQAYEARFFDTARELRWRRSTRGESGNAVVLAEAAQSLPAGWENAEPLRLLDSQHNRYLIWGVSAARSEDGFTRLHRLPPGSAWLPVECAGRDLGYQLLTCEYLGTSDDEFGNVSVVEERWLRLVAAEQEDVA